MVRRHQSQLDMWCHKQGIGIECHRIGEVADPFGEGKSKHTMVRFVIKVLYLSRPTLAASEWQRLSAKRLIVDFYQGTGCKDNPSVGDVLSSLILDARSGELGWEEYCSEYGVDSDSRRGYATWEKCRDFAPKLRDFLDTSEKFDEAADQEH